MKSFLKICKYAVFTESKIHSVYSFVFHLSINFAVELDNTLSIEYGTFSHFGSLSVLNIT